jgi:hypothetical protein
MAVTGIAEQDAEWSVRRLEWIAVPSRQAHPPQPDLLRWVTGPDYAPDVKWAVITRYYRLRDEPTVAAFLFDRPRLLNAVLDAYATLSAIFGPEASAELRLRADPEIPTRRYVAVLIVTGLPVEDALSRAERFDAEWWLDRIGDLGQELVFTLEFI